MKSSPGVPCAVSWSSKMSIAPKRLKIRFLQQMKDLGLNLKTFLLQSRLQRYSHLRTSGGAYENVWRHLGKWVGAAAADQKPERESDHAMVQEETRDLWENRYVLFKAEKRMSPEEKQIEIVEADEQIGRLRAFLGGVYLRRPMKSKPARRWTA